MSGNNDGVTIKDQKTGKEYKITEEGLMYEDTIPIPNGFTESTVEGETEVDKGKVVIAPDESEFVWVPVANAVLDVTSETTDEEINAKITAETNQGKYPMAIEVTEGVYKGVLYEFNSTNGTPTAIEYKTTSTSYREPATLSEEYSKMVESVEKNRGFYIGRYETSIKSGSGSSAIVQSKGETFPMNASTSSGNTWYGMYTNQKAYADSQAGVQGGMIWGSQWDQVMVWMKDVQNETQGKPYIVDSRGMGWYADNFAPGNTGKRTGREVNENALNKVKNIWDMSGNLYDWTIEGNLTASRVCRGRRLRRRWT